MAKHTILIVDDDSGVRNALARALRGEDYAVLFAESCAAAREILSREHLDLLLCDHQMPEMSGLEFIKEVRASHAGILRIMMSGHADVEVLAEAINVGEIYRFVKKPWDDDELKMTLRTALSHLDATRENQALLATVQSQAKVIREIQKPAPRPVPRPAKASDEGDAS